MFMSDYASSGLMNGNQQMAEIATDGGPRTTHSQRQPT